MCVFSVMRRYRTNVSHSVTESVSDSKNRVDWCYPGEWRYLLKTLHMWLWRLRILIWKMLEMMIRVLLIRIGPQNYQVRHVFYSYVFFWTRPLNHFFCENLTQLNSDFGKLRTSAFTWYTLDTSDMIFNLRKMRLRLHSFGPVWTISTENQWEISEVCRFS